MSAASNGEADLPTLVGITCPDYRQTFTPNDQIPFRARVGNTRLRPVEVDIAWEMPSEDLTLGDITSLRVSEQSTEEVELLVEFSNSPLSSLSLPVEGEVIGKITNVEVVEEGGGGGGGGGGGQTPDAAPNNSYGGDELYQVPNVVGENPEAAVAVAGLAGGLAAEYVSR